MAAGPISCRFFIDFLLQSTYTFIVETFRKYIIILITIIVIAIASLFILIKYGVKSNDLESTISQNQNWQTYINISYGYEILYPENASVSQVSEEESGSIEQSEAVYVQIPGVGNKFAITMYLPYKNAPEPLAGEQLKLVTLPLKQFAEAIRQLQINDDNPNTKDRKVGELKETILAGQKAYSFTLTKSFNKGLAGGYILSKDGTVFNFIFVENKAREKLMIHYPLNGVIAEQIKNSFEFLVK